jgi:hypothetical protein
MRGLDTQATIIQQAARGWLARNKGKYEKQRKKMEEMMREAARQAEAERRAKLANERAERRAARLREHQKLADQIATLEKSFQNFEWEQDELVRLARERNENTRREIEAMKRQFAHDEAEKIQQRRVEQAEEERRIEEAKKLIAYLTKENKRARKENLKVKTKHDKESKKNEVIVGANNSINEKLQREQDFSDRGEKLKQLVKDKIKAAKDEHKSLTDLVVEHQIMYMDQAKARLKLQKAMAQILSSVQERVEDRTTVEETVVSALAAESYSKSVMAALDMETSEPDLACSDCSDSVSVLSEISDWQSEASYWN